ncbi:MAG: YheV family putative metal-binding protein [Pseudomonadota bacterium]
MPWRCLWPFGVVSPISTPCCVRTGLFRVAEPVKRFIAGARCPSCGQTDTVYILKATESVSRHCTRCNLNEKLPDAPAAVSAWAPVRLKD